MASAALSSPVGSVTLSRAVVSTLEGSLPRMQQVVFPGTDGEEFIYDGRSYEVLSVTGWVTASSLSGIDDAIQALDEALASLDGASTSSLVVTYDDSSTTTVSYIVAAQAVRGQGRAAQISASLYCRAVSFAVRRISGGA